MCEFLYLLIHRHTRVCVYTCVYSYAAHEFYLINGHSKMENGVAKFCNVEHLFEYLNIKIKEAKNTVIYRMNDLTKFNLALEKLKQELLEYFLVKNSEEHDLLFYLDEIMTLGRE